MASWLYPSGSGVQWDRTGGSSSVDDGMSCDLYAVVADGFVNPAAQIVDALWKAPALLCPERTVGLLEVLLEFVGRCRQGRSPVPGSAGTRRELSHGPIRTSS